jgi:hypothetical protein
MLVRRSETTIFRAVGRETLLAAPDREDVDRLSESAAAVWRVLDAPRSRAEVAAMVAGLYGDQGPALRSDVDALLDTLIDRGWVEVVDG